MKKNLFIFFLFITFTFSLFADEYVISDIQCYKKAFGNIEKEEISFKFFDDEDNSYSLQWSTYSRLYWFIFESDSLRQLRTNLLKAKEWINIAKENKTNITKEIPNSSISFLGAMRSDNNFYTAKRLIPIRFFFACDVEKSYYTIFLEGRTEKTMQNEFVDIEFENIYFVNNQIDDFIDAISPEIIEKAKLRHQQEKKASDLFQ